MIKDTKKSRMMKTSEFGDFKLVYTLSSDLKSTEIEKLRQLYIEVYGEKIGTSSLITTFQNGDITPWKWKFASKNRIPAEMAFAYDNTRLIGHTSILPHKAKIYDDITHVGQGLDSMVSPDYQKRGLFSAMSRFLFQELSDDIKFLYAFPNQNNITPRIKLGWTPLFEIPWNEKRTSEGKLSENVRPITSFNEDFDILWKKVSKDMKFSLVKDSEYLNWRFNQNPLEKYQTLVATGNKGINGYLVWKNYSEQGQVIDTLAIDVKTQRELLSHLEAVLHQRGINSMALFVPQKGILHKSVMHDGFEPKKRDTFFTILPKNPMNINKIKQHIYVQMSDNDIF